jgi:S-DNA-T family DNA segregation ATPase FtsK/SpoIIIE
MLKKVKDEMDRRFEYLEKTGNKEIIPARDKMDKIVVGIDEASVLYSKVKANATKAHLINTAREYTDELAKLARAAGIHLIFATQKVSKETIDTKVQENIGGRVCFRMNTMTNSVTVLGNKRAFELPDIKGRAVWASGNEFLEIQAPFLEDEELKSEIEILQEKFSSNYPCFRPMMNIDGPINNDNEVKIPEGN